MVVLDGYSMGLQGDVGTERFTRRSHSSLESHILLLYVNEPRPHAQGLLSLALGQVAEEEEARRCHRHGRRTGTNAIGWLAGLAARLPLPWRAVQGQTHPLSLQAAVAAAVSEESALLAAIAVASCCC